MVKFETDSSVQESTVYPILRIPRRRPIRRGGSVRDRVRAQDNGITKFHIIYKSNVKEHNEQTEKVQCSQCDSCLPLEELNECPTCSEQYVCGDCCSHFCSEEQWGCKECRCRYS